MVTKLDRLARNVSEGIELIRALFKKDVKVHVLNIGLLENTSMGNFFITTLLAVAELERNMIIERTQAGKEVARTKAGFREGRPPLLCIWCKLDNILKASTSKYPIIQTAILISAKTSILQNRLPN